MSEEKKGLVQATGFWIKEKNGQQYLSGKVDGVPVLIFKNKYKKAGDNKPDRIMFWQDTPPAWFTNPQQQKLPTSNKPESDDDGFPF